MQHYLVLIHYVNNQVESNHQQLLWLEPLATLAGLNNDMIDRIVDKFVAHNFSLDADWDLYYYVTGLNDSQSPFYYRKVQDCILSPFTDNSKPRFSVDDNNDADTGSLVDKNRNEGSLVTPVDSQKTLRDRQEASDMGEPDAVLDALMEKNKRKRDDDHGLK